MTDIGWIIAVALLLSLITATGKTFYDLSKSNTIGEEEGTAADFMKDGQDVRFYETCDGKKR